jgi:hypothetical protein
MNEFDQIRLIASLAPGLCKVAGTDAWQVLWTA